MTTDSSTWETVQADIPRDRWGKPLVMKPDGSGKRTAYKRVTNFISVLEDEYKLKQWERRATAYGMSQRPDLVMAAAAVSMDIKDRDALQKVADAAKEHAMASAAANIGTALHKFCERLDRGEPLGRVPDPYGADIKIYEKTMARFGIEHQAIESFRVFDDWQVAGTTDRIVKVDGRYYIADIKTGRVDFGISKMAMQFAMYKHSKPYDIPTDTRSVDPYFVDNEKALLIHLPAGEAVCELHWINIQEGWRMCGIAKQVWDARYVKRDKITWPLIDQYEMIPHDELRASATANFIAKALACNSLEDLKALYFSAQLSNQDTTDFVAAVKQRKAQLLAVGS